RRPHRGRGGTSVRLWAAVARSGWVSRTAQIPGHVGSGGTHPSGVHDWFCDETPAAERRTQSERAATILLPNSMVRVGTRNNERTGGEGIIPVFQHVMALDVTRRD